MICTDDQKLMFFDEYVKAISDVILHESVMARAAGAIDLIDVVNGTPVPAGYVYNAFLQMFLPPQYRAAPLMRAQ